MNSLGWYVEQYQSATKLWVYVGGSEGSYEHAAEVLRRLSSAGRKVRLGRGGGASVPQICQTQGPARPQR